MPLMDHEFARRDGNGVELRSSPMRVHWRFEEIIASDQHSLRIRFTASLQVPDDPTDRKVFAEVMLTRAGAVTAEHLAEHFRPGLLAAAREAARFRAAEEWIGRESQQAMLDAILNAAKATAFSCGLQILPPFQLEISSPSFDQQQRQNQRVAAQTQSLQRAHQLLEHFEELRAASPQTSAGGVLRQMPANEQSEMLAAILAARADETAASPLWIVSGESVLQLTSDHPSPREIARLDALGPLRSISPSAREAGTTLLIGAQRGVYEVDSHSGAVLQAYEAQTLSDFGFNSAARVADTMYATHVEAGLLSWSAGQPAEVLHRAFIPAVAPPLRESGQSVAFSQSGSRGASRVIGPRNVVRFGPEAALFAVGGKLMLVEGPNVQAVDEGESHIVAILQDRDRTVIVRNDGQLQAMDSFSRGIADLQHLRRTIRTAGAVPWMGSIRLLIADESGAVDCIGLEDAAVVRFLSSHVDLRMLSGSAERVAAVASDRQRILLWTIANAQSPAREIHVASITRHRVAAIAFGP